MSMLRWRGVMTLWMISIVTVAYAVGAPPTIQTDTAVHFSALDGNDVIIEQGTYRVEAIKDGLKLIPTVGNDKEAILIQATSMAHKERIESPQASLKVVGEDEMTITLLMSEGQGMEATGSRSGVHARAAGVILPPGGCCNTALGENALLFQDNRLNTAVGYFALKANSSGNHNTANGALALNTNTIGFSNVAVGYQSLFQNLSGNDNTAVGTGSLGSNDSGKENTAIGSQALLKNKEATTTLLWVLSRSWKM